MVGLRRVFYLNYQQFGLNDLLCALVREDEEVLLREHNSRTKLQDLRFQLDVTAIQESWATLQQWHLAVIRWFLPSLKNVDTKKYFIAWVWAITIAHVRLKSVDVTPPTAHERVEAILELREWARGKVPDELLKTLF